MVFAFSDWYSPRPEAQVVKFAFDGFCCFESSECGVAVSCEDDLWVFRRLEYVLYCGSGFGFVVGFSCVVVEVDCSVHVGL